MFYMYYHILFSQQFYIPLFIFSFPTLLVKKKLKVILNDLHNFLKELSNGKILSNGNPVILSNSIASLNRIENNWIQFNLSISF